MGERACQTTHIHNEWAIFHKVVSAMSWFVILNLTCLCPRKCLLLFNWLTPLTTIMAQQSVPYSSERSSEGLKPSQKPLLYAALYAPPPVLLDLVNSVSDDIAVFSKLGLLGKRTGDRAARFSDWCWLIGTLVGLVENGLERGVVGNLQREGILYATSIASRLTKSSIVESRLYTESMSGATAKSKPTASRIDERELSRLRTKDYWLRISRAKLVMDLIFVCTWPLFDGFVVSWLTKAHSLRCVQNQTRR